MKRIEYPIERGGELINLLKGEEKFKILGELVVGDSLAAYVLCGHTGFTWGHFYRAAFCAICPVGENKIVLSISHLDIEKTWYGVNIFSRSDRTIEDQILQYVSQRIPDGRKVNGNPQQLSDSKLTFQIEEN